MIVFPNAKINIGLFVTEKRTDGFHNLETVFYPVQLSDILEINQTQGKDGTYSFHNSGIEIGGEAENNLIVKAWRLLSAAYRLPAIQIHLHKVIPFGAGLGGGSADAAFMLKALNEYFELQLTGSQLTAYAAALGSDCAFFVRNHPAFAWGRGDLMQDLSLSLESYRLVIVKPPFGVSTAEAYTGIHPQPATFDLRQLADLPLEEWKQVVKNDFEQNVFIKYPRLAEIKQQLYRSGALYAAMTGSGSALYAIFEKGTTPQLEYPDCFIWQENK